MVAAAVVGLFLRLVVPAVVAVVVNSDSTAASDYQSVTVNLRNRKTRKNKATSERLKTITDKHMHIIEQSGLSPSVSSLLWKFNLP